MTYSNKFEATAAIRQFNKAMATVRERYTKPGQADRIIDRMIADKFGADIDISVIISEYAAGKYDVICGRMHQADKARASRIRDNEAAKQTLLAEMTALYCGAGSVA